MAAHLDAAAAHHHRAGAAAADLGRRPGHFVTVSWSAPGTVAQPAPTLRYSAERYAETSSVSFTDGLNGQTTYAYHAQLTGLHPGTRYHYEVSDGASAPTKAGASFETAPAGRARYRFSSYGDLATPSWDLNASGNTWQESCDNSYYAVNAIENPAPCSWCWAAVAPTARPTPTVEDTTDDLPQAKVITERNAITGSEAAGFTRNAADSVEDAPWSASRNTTDAYGYAIFDVDPGHGRGETTITMQYFAIPVVSNKAGPAHDGTTTLPSVPAETFVFGRKVNHA